jgi:hypothetical protein
MNYVNFEFIFTAGYTKESKSNPTDQHKTSLASQMLKYTERHFEGFPIGESYPVAWGTYEETCHAIRIIREYRDNYGCTVDKIFVSTNPGHMPRVKLCWQYLAPSEWDVRFIPADHKFTKKEWAQETVKFFWYLYKFLFKKW